MERQAQKLHGDSCAMPGEGEGADTIHPFGNRMETAPTFPILPAPHGRSMHRAASLPAACPIDRQGHIVAGAIGGRDFDLAEIKPAVCGLLKRV